ncbi:MAG: DUF1566 domain-containing protein [Desulfobacter sp.]|nr:MAG: DUF1566 domain-containing protein [Desulfobacter sp.]
MTIEFKVLALALVFTGALLPSMLPASDKKTCYSEYGLDVPCPGAGAEKGTAVLIDNGDGTVMDLRTGYLWQQADDGKDRSWQAAGDYCSALELGGHSGWRMPEFKELETVAEYGRSQYEMSRAFSYHAASYWTATPHKRHPEKAATIGFSVADSIAYPKTGSHRVRCVCIK